MSAIFVVLALAALVLFIVIGCKLYKKRLSREKTQNEQHKLEVLNMKSQIAMIHGQMTGICTYTDIHTHRPYILEFARMRFCNIRGRYSYTSYAYMYTQTANILLHMNTVYDT